MANVGSMYSKPSPPPNVVPLLSPVTSVDQIPEEYRTTPSVLAHVPTATPPSSTLISSSGGNQGDMWEQLGAGGYSGLNSALLGIPDLLVKTVDSPTYKALKDLRERNQQASDIGGLVGDVGSFLIPGGGLVGGGLKLASKLGKGAQLGSALGKVGEVAGAAEKALNARGGALGERIMRGVAQAGTTAIPTALTGALTTGEWDPTQTALQLGIGGGLGAAGYGLGKVGKALMDTKIGKTISGPVKKVIAGMKEESGDTLDDAILSGADMGTRVFKTALNDTAKYYNLDRYGNLFNNADSFKKKAASFILKNKLQDKITREEFLKDQGPLWTEITEKYNAKPLNIRSEDFVKDFNENPKVKQFVSDPHVGADGIVKAADDLLKGITDKGGNIADFNQAKIFLGNEARKAGKLVNTANSEESLSKFQAKQDIANALRQSVEEHALSLDPAYAELKKNYPIIKAMKIASGIEQLNVENPLKEGSDTFSKLAAGAALGGAGGLGIGDEDNKGGLGILGAIGGAAAAPFAARLGSKFATQALAGAAGKAKELGQNEGVTKYLGNMLGQTENNLAKLPGLTGQPNLNPQPEQAQAPAPTPAQPTDAQLKAPSASTTPQGTPVPATAQSAQPEPKQVYMANVQDRLKNIYLSQGFNQYFDFNDFASRLAQKTNNFDPKYMAKILYDDPEMQKRYAKNVVLASQIKELPIGDIVASMGNIFGTSPELAQATEQFAALLNGGKPMSKADSKDFMENMARIKKLPPQKQDKALKSLMKSNYDLDFDELARLGVV